MAGAAGRGWATVGAFQRFTLTVEGRTGGGGAVGRATAAKVERVEQ